MINFFSKYYLYFFLVLYVYPCNGSVYHAVSSIPKFASVKCNNANVRQGPNINSPVIWQFIKKNEPIRIIAMYNHWFQIQDYENATGWIHSNLVSNSRFVIVNIESDMFSNKYEEASVIAKLVPKLRCSLLKSDKIMSYICCNSYKGWVFNKNLWGI
ncbi:SH3 domain-containing protein [Rickettsia endosymbiont of Cardiosporidium cionae]|uniref:SH3 domain-containing protein n=1 Tax=Rickettsia endosymbiont of Cardiosporidium cionae TaxID=2777155 RepID=UPI0018930BA0|nr:SH3 domain-containing protein [Rickettsia endosymbiont of Cardiosporidium cionae]KAF8818494.1 hypothetical protein IHI24_000588 [Rickettsia endosymbiont of Cardiosporidium cionae]